MTSSRGWKSGLCNVSQPPESTLFLIELELQHYFAVNYSAQQVETKICIGCNPTLKGNTSHWVSALKLRNIKTKGDVRNTNIFQQPRTMPPWKVEWGSLFSCCGVNVLGWNAFRILAQMCLWASVKDDITALFVGQIFPNEPTGDTGWTCRPFGTCPSLKSRAPRSLIVDFHVQQRSGFGTAVALGGPEHGEGAGWRVLCSVKFNKLAQAWWVRLPADEARFLSDMTQATAPEPGSQTEGKA